MKPELSICMMVKDEEKNLVRCLQSLAPLRDTISTELIIIDTGSIDRTVEIAKRFTDKLYFNQWNNNFAEMRNLTISYAVGQWILILDADEELEIWEDIISFLKSRPAKSIACATMLVKNITSSFNKCYVTTVSPRLFRNDKYFHYRGSVHNEPIFRGEIASLNSALLHYGYIADDQVLMEQKFKRTCALLKAELEKDPDNIYYRYQLGITYAMHKDWPDALREFEAIYDKHKEDDFVLSKHIYIIGALIQANVACANSDEDIISIGLRGIQLEPEYVDLYYYLAKLYDLSKDSDKAYKYYAKHVDLANNFSNLKIKNNLSLNHYTLLSQNEDYFCMGLIAIRKKEYRIAKMHFLKVLEISSGNEPFIDHARSFIFEINFKEKEFSASRAIYGTLLEKKQVDIVAKIEHEIENLWKKQGLDVRLAFCNCFKDISNLFGLLNHLRMKQGDIDANDWNLIDVQLVELDLNHLPVYYAPILAYSMKFRSQQAVRLSARLSEQSIVGYMSYLDEIDKMMFVDICRNFINTENDNVDYPYQLIRLQKNIAKYLLFSGTLDDEEYKHVFDIYIAKGRYFIEALYNKKILDQELIFDLKNNEEVFLLYMKFAADQKEQLRYIHYLKKALDVYPEMFKGIDGIIQSIQMQPNYNEMDELLEQMLVSINNLTETEQYDAALTVIEECRNIIGDDIRLLAIKSDILIRKFQ